LKTILLINKKENFQTPGQNNISICSEQLAEEISMWLITNGIGGITT
jgi:hypothetical protein